MLWTIFVILLILWLLGVVSSYTLGGFIHLLLVIALIVILFRLIAGRPV
ncbi:MAG: lmo0937 family membrane protein [Acidobacteriota bacterium]